MTTTEIVRVPEGESLRRQIRAEFIEMPGLTVTLRQGARLWNLDLSTCAAVLRGLVEEGFLYQSGREAFRRADA